MKIVCRLAVPACAAVVGCDKHLFQVDATAEKIENTGKEIPLGDQEGDPDLKFGAIDDRGQEQPSITFIGDFERCTDADAPKPFAKGKSYESCLAFLVGGDGSIDKVQWKGSDKYILKPVEWK
jgi:hypothetical protein